MEKNWKLKNLFPQGGEEGHVQFDSFINDVRNLNGRIKIPESIAKILFMRGVTNHSKVFKFFKPSIDKLYDPLLMKGCKIARDRLIESISNNEKIMLLGDYDVDGILGATMFSLFLKEFGIDAEVFIPNRINQEYGLSNNAVDEAHNKGITLIISIDCGITAISTVEYAKEKGIETIICDHHQAPEQLPDALAIMDPIQPGCEYPFKFLCGTGVAFKLIQAVCEKLGKEKLAYSLLDLVAIATSSDIVPIIDENRILVNAGFEKINTKPRASIKTLIEKIGLKDNKVNTMNIVFSLAPRINAVGRLGEASRAVDMLISEDASRIDELVEILDSENVNRREIDKIITENAFSTFEQDYNDSNNYSIVLHNNDWHPGVISIVAARLVEKYNRPAIVLTTIKDTAKGSARSINGFNIYEALKKCEHLLIQFGGHCHAAGLEIKPENISEFRKLFNNLVKEEIEKDQLKPEIEVDIEIGLNEINPTFTKIISFFEPFGPGNSQPVFMTRNVRLYEDGRFNKSHTHMLKFIDEKSDKIWHGVFHNSEKFEGLLTHDKLCDICFTIDKIYSNGNIKLNIKDIKIH